MTVTDMPEDLIYRLRKRAEIRRQIATRKSVQENKPDRIADLLEEAANEIDRLNAVIIIIYGDNMSIWFTSDTHFHHENIIDYCRRPFAHAYEMNNEMIRRWNEVVKPEDTVYHLGDFAMGPKTLIHPTREKLNGKIILVLGNHDRNTNTMLAAGFDRVYDDVIKTLDSHTLYMRHKPELDTSKWHGCEYHLHGHVHEHYTRHGNAINVGVDVWNFTPQRLEALLSSSPTPTQE